MMTFPLKKRVQPFNLRDLPGTISHVFTCFITPVLYEWFISVWLCFVGMGESPNPPTSWLTQPKMMHSPLHLKPLLPHRRGPPLLLPSLKPNAQPRGGDHQSHNQPKSPKSPNWSPSGPLSQTTATRRMKSSGRKRRWRRSSSLHAAPVRTALLLRSCLPACARHLLWFQKWKRLWRRYEKPFPITFCTDTYHPFVLFLHNSNNKHCFLHSFFLCMVLHSMIQTLHSDFPHPTRSLISWPICLMCWASPKMLCALMPQAQLNRVNISWTCWL